MDFLDLLQWPAMVVTLAAAWLVASASNVLWTVWGWHSGAYALIVLQVGLAAMNVRGVYKNDPELKVTTGKS